MDARIYSSIQGLCGIWWWLGQDNFAAVGVFGQLIHVNADQKLVIATHSAWDTAGSRAYYMHRTAFVEALTAHLSGDAR